MAYRQSRPRVPSLYQFYWDQSMVRVLAEWARTPANPTNPTAAGSAPRTLRTTGGFRCLSPPPPPPDAPREFRHVVVLPAFSSIFSAARCRFAAGSSFIDGFDGPYDPSWSISVGMSVVSLPCDLRLRGSPRNNGGVPSPWRERFGCVHLNRSDRLVPFAAKVPIDGRTG